MFDSNADILKKREEFSAVLVGVINQKQTEDQAIEYLDELAFLAKTAGVESQKYYTQSLEKPNPKSFVGTGKLAEIADYVKERNIDFIIFDDELSPSQLKNIEELTECKILDRSDLILFIFQERAQTAQAKAQVELAQMQYLLPRLKRMWTHLERQRGGTSTRGGSGEKEIETDRRIIRDKITKLKAKLEDIEKQSSTQRKKRGEFIRVALVGYTNVGKTTTMNLLTKGELFAENKLFATLDTTVRKMTLRNVPFLISDTVGFIRKLPHHLVESFKSTLDETKEADIILHVVDFAHPNFEEHIEVVNRTLAELGAAPDKTIMVFNKIDAYRKLQLEDNDPFFSDQDMKDLEATWTKRLGVQVAFISAIEKENIDLLRDIMFENIKELYTKRYPYKAKFLY